MADKSIHQRSKIYKKNSQRIGLLINTNNTKVSISETRRALGISNGGGHTNSYTKIRLQRPDSNRALTI